MSTGIYEVIYKELKTYERMRDTLRDIESGSHVIRVKVGPGLTPFSTSRPLLTALKKVFFALAPMLRAWTFCARCLGSAAFGPSLYRASSTIVDVRKPPAYVLNA